MNYKDNIEWLKSLKQQIGKTQHCDLWHFEQVIDETIENLKPLAKPHGRLIDAERLFNIFEPITSFPEDEQIMYVEAFLTAIKQAQTIVEAEVSE